MKLGRELFTRLQVKAAVRDAATKINHEAFSVRELTVVPVIKGALWFYSSLVPMLEPHATVQADLYERGLPPVERIRLFGNISPTSRVILLDGIVDTGETVLKVGNYLKVRHGIENVGVYSLITRHRSAKLVTYSPLITDSDRFLAGCGMDVDEQLRDMDSIYEVEER